METGSTEQRPAPLGAIHVAHAIVRGVSPAFEQCERRDRGTAIDLARAAEQHREYVRALCERIPNIVALPPSPVFPDCVFVEDAAVVLNAHTALITRPGAASRRGEVTVVATALLGLGLDVVHMREPARLDGGDVLCTGHHVFVGMSSRTDAAGFAAVQRVGEAHGLVVVSVPVKSGLHLKSGCSLADEHTLLFDASMGLEPAPFEAAGLTCVAVDERLGANVLALGDGRVLVSSACPRAEAMLRDRGLSVVSLEMSELHKADGAMTCPSIRIPAPGAWCT
jgi:dimethylargininase